LIFHSPPRFSNPVEIAAEEGHVVGRAVLADHPFDAAVIALHPRLVAGDAHHDVADRVQRLAPRFQDRDAEIDEIHRIAAPEHVIVAAVGPVDGAQQLGIAAVDGVAIAVQAIPDRDPVQHMLERVLRHSAAQSL
jgi:hypothetical protein